MMLPSHTCNSSTSPRSIQNVEGRANSAKVLCCGYRCIRDTLSYSANSLYSRDPDVVRATCWAVAPPFPCAVEGKKEPNILLPSLLGLRVFWGVRSKKGDWLCSSPACSFSCCRLHISGTIFLLVCREVWGSARMQQSKASICSGDHQ